MDLTLEFIVALFLFSVFIVVCCALALTASMNSHLRHSAPQKRPLGVAVDAPILGPAVPIEGRRVQYFVAFAILAHLVGLTTIVIIGPAL